ncbi:MAG: class I SAM-dependent methyltransferase [Thermoplasmatota archaeon]
MKVKCFSVKPRKAEKVRRALMELGVLRHEYPVISETDQVLFPVDDDLDPADLDGIGAVIQVVERELNPRKTRPKNYRELLELSPERMDLLPSSYDMIGDVAIIKLPKELLDFRRDVGHALREFNRNIRAVALDRGVSGELRIRDLEVISGEDDLETTHVENNLKFKLDPSKVYFSPRLATERMRIAELVGEENVLDMFAGVGPFSIGIARQGRASKVIGIDLNPECIRYFNTNITLNSVDDRVETHLGDARDISTTLGPFDRIIMNLPHCSMDFLDVAFGSMDSGHIHLYRVLEQGRIMEEVQDMSRISRDLGKEIKVIGIREVHNYAPTQSMMAFDIKVLP